MFEPITWLAVMAMQSAQEPIDLTPRIPDMSQVVSDMEWLESANIAELSEEFTRCVEGHFFQSFEEGAEPQSILIRRNLVEKAFLQCGFDQHREALIEAVQAYDPDVTTEIVERRVNTHIGSIYSSIVYSNLFDMGAND